MNASLIPWSDSSLNRMNRLFDNAFGDFMTPRVFGTASTRTWAPPVDIRETDEELVLTAELPGMRREDVAINLENGVLTVSGERSLEHKEGKEDYHRVERSYGSFSRSFTLPSNVDPEKAEAAFRDGLLTVTLPKLETAKPRRIEIS